MLYGCTNNEGHRPASPEGDKMENLTVTELQKIAEDSYATICEFHEICADGHATAESESAYELATRSYQSAMFWLSNK